MKNVSAWFYAIANKKNLIFFTLLTALITLVLFPALSTHFSSSQTPISLLDTNINYTAQEAIDHINTYTTQERNGVIKITLLADTLYPLIYTTTFILALSLLFKSAHQQNKPTQYLNLLPLLAMLFDLTENVSILLLIRSHPNISMPIASFVAIITPLKWATIFINVLLLTYQFSYNRGQKKQIKTNATK